MTARRMGSSSRVTAAAVLCLLICLAAPAAISDRQAFDRAARTGTAAAFDQFIKAYPASALAADARQRATALREPEAQAKYEELKTVKKTSLLERFIRDYPGTRAAAMARLRVAEIDFSDLASQDPFRPARSGNQSWVGFVNTYAFGNTLPEPQDAQLREAYYRQLHPLIIQALVKANSFDVWKAYLIKYPASPYTTQATTRIEEMLTSRSQTWEGYQLFQDYAKLWEKDLKRPCPNQAALQQRFSEGLGRKVLEGGSPEEFKRYVAAFPNSPHVQSVNSKAAHQVFAEALLRNDVKTLLQLIDQYAALDSPQIQADRRQARIKIEQADYKELESAETIEPFQRFRKKYAGNDLAGLLPPVDARITHERKNLLAKAMHSGSLQQLTGFLKVFPDAPEKAEVTKALEEAEFKEAMASGNQARIQSVLARYPNSVFARVGQTRIEQAAFEQAVNAARAAPTTAPLAAYIEGYRQGAYVKDAERLIAEINSHYGDYMKQYAKASESGNTSRFAEWISANTANYYASKRGRNDVVALKREIAIRQLVASVNAPPRKQAQSMLASSLPRMLDERSRAIVDIATNVGQTTGFALTNEGLLVTNGDLIRNAGRNQVSAAVGTRKLPCEPAYVPEAAGADCSVLKIDMAIDPIPLGNPTALETSDRVYCLSSRNGKVVHSEGELVEARNAGGKDWMLIRSTTIPANLGGVVLNRRAEGVGMIVPRDQVDPTVRRAENDIVYALSVRSLLPSFEKAIMRK